MRTLFTALAAATLVAGVVSPAAARPICLQSILIDHTSVKDSQTLLFHMKNGDIFSNTLKTRCPGLNFHGFVMNFRGGNNEICSNQENISVLVTHETCPLGEFVPYTAPKPPAKS